MTPRSITRQSFRATGYPNWNQKLRLSRWEEFGMGVLFWRWGTKIPNSNTRVQKIPKFHQKLSGIIMHTFGIQR
jgi:hypothetical protein